MKKYFAKYLPLEVNVETFGFKHTIGYEGKLFLCSNDILVGDKIWNGREFLTWEQGDEDDCLYNPGVKILNKGCIKVIGEISPEAVWVKDGDGFDEEEWVLCGCYDDDGTGEFDHLSQIVKGKEQNVFNNPKWKNLIIKIKCDKCRTFH